MNVSLGAEEIAWGENLSQRLRAYDRERGYSDRMRAKDKEAKELLGVLGKMAVSKALNIPLKGFQHKPTQVDGVVRDKEVSVRTRSWRGDLLVDRPKRNLHYILVYAFPPDFQLVGWMKGDEVKKVGEDMGAFWVVDVSHLHAMRELV